MRFNNNCLGNESAKQEKTGIPTLCKVVICVTHLEKKENVIGNLNVNVKIHNWQCQGYVTSMSIIHRIMSRLCDGNVKDPYWNVLCECHISIGPCRGYVNVNVTYPYDHVEVMWTSMSMIHHQTLFCLTESWRRVQGILEGTTCTVNVWNDDRIGYRRLQ